jgi:hypothetical protein
MSNIFLNSTTTGSSEPSYTYLNTWFNTLGATPLATPSKLCVRNGTGGASFVDISAHNLYLYNNSGQDCLINFIDSAGSDGYEIKTARTSGNIPNFYVLNSNQSGILHLQSKANVKVDTGHGGNIQSFTFDTSGILNAPTINVLDGYFELSNANGKKVSLRNNILTPDIDTLILSNTNTSGLIILSSSVVNVSGRLVITAPTGGTGQASFGTASNRMVINANDSASLFMTGGGSNLTEVAIGASSNVPLSFLTDNKYRGQFKTGEGGLVINISSNTLNEGLTITNKWRSGNTKKASVNFVMSDTAGEEKTLGKIYSETQNDNIVSSDLVFETSTANYTTSKVMTLDSAGTTNINRLNCSGIITGASISGYNCDIRLVTGTTKGRIDIINEATDVVPPTQNPAITLRNKTLAQTQAQSKSGTLLYEAGDNSLQLNNNQALETGTSKGRISFVPQVGTPQQSEEDRQVIITAHGGFRPSYLKETSITTNNTDISSGTMFWNIDGSKLSVIQDGILNSVVVENYSGQTTTLRTLNATKATIGNIAGNNLFIEDAGTSILNMFPNFSGGAGGTKVFQLYTQLGSDGDIGIGTNGATNVYCKASTQRVGINRISPNHTLDVSGVGHFDVNIISGNATISGFLRVSNVSGNPNMNNFQYRVQQPLQAWWMITGSGYNLSGVGGTGYYNQSGFYLFDISANPSGVQSYNLYSGLNDTQWFTLGVNANVIAEQFRDYITFWLKNAPNGTEIKFVGKHNGDIGGWIFRATKQNSDFVAIFGYPNATSGGTIYRNFATFWTGWSDITALYNW